MLDVEHYLSKGDMLLDQYWNAGVVDDLTNAVSGYRLAVELSNEDTAPRIRAQLAVANGLRVLFEEGLAGEDEYLESLTLAETALTATEKCPQLLLDATMVLAEVLLRNRHSRDEEGCIRAEQACRRFADLAKEVQSALLTKALSLQAIAVSRRGSMQQDEAYLNEANALVDQVLQSAGGEDRFIHEVSTAASVARTDRFLLRKQWDDIYQAQEVMEALISRMSPSDPRLYAYYNQIGFCCRLQYRSGRSEALDPRISAYSEAAKRVPYHSPVWHLILGNYANALHDRYLERSRLEDLDDAVSVARAVYQHMQESLKTSKPLFMDLFANNLVAFLGSSYAQYGRLELLDEVVTVHLQTLEVVPKVRRYMSLRNAGLSYVTRFDVHGRFSDLRAAIACFRESISTAGDTAWNIMVSKNLAGALLTMYEETGETLHLEEAISLLQVIVADAQHSFIGESHSLLGQAFLLRFVRKGVSADIKNSIEHLSTALELLPPTNTETPVAYSRLGVAQYHRALSENGDLELANASLTAFDSALSILANHHPDRAKYLGQRADSELLLAQISDEFFYDRALGTLRDASASEWSWTADRYVAAVKWAQLSTLR